LGPSSLPVVVAQPDSERHANRTASLLGYYGKGGATGGLGEQSPHSSQGHFCKSSKTDKILGVWGVMSPTIFEFQPEFVTSGFQRSNNLTYILSNS